jgi:hypothetical protein
MALVFSGITDDHAGHIRPSDGNDGPLQVRAGEALQLVMQAAGAVAPDRAAAGIEDTNLHELLVDIESDRAAHG